MRKSWVNMTLLCGILLHNAAQGGFLLYEQHQTDEMVLSIETAFNGFIKRNLFYWIYVCMYVCISMK